MTSFAYALRLVLFCGKLRLLESRAGLAGHLQCSSVSKHLKPINGPLEHRLTVEETSSRESGMRTFDCMFADT